MKSITVTILVFQAALLSAQQPALPSFVWGGVIGFESQLLNIQSQQTGEPDQMRVESARAASGGSLGLFGRWQIWKGLFVQPGISYSTIRARVDFQPGGPEYYQFSDLEFPLHFVLTNHSVDNAPLRGSLLLGARLGWNFGPQSTDKLILLRERLAADAGLGVEIRVGKWRIQPEFVYSLGLNNQHDVTNAPFDWAVGRVLRDKLELRVLLWLPD
jgi:hypothetical protein